MLEGISPLLPDQVCGPRKKTWPCGKFAHTAFQRLIRQRAISCNPVEGDSSGAIHTRCRVSGHDLGGWLVKQGWATAIAGSGYETLESEARQNRKGKWQKGAE